MNASAQPRPWWSQPAFWLSGLGVFVLLAVGLFGLLPGVFLGTESFFYRDYGLFGYPLAHFQRAAFWRGELPLWNPYNECGLPFLAQWNTLCLYPGALIYLILPLPQSLGWFMLAHLLLGGMGMRSLVLRMTRDERAAAFAAAGYAFNGLVLHCLMWPNNIAALGLLPWVVRSWAALDNPKPGRIAIAALLTGVQILTGAPEIIGFTWACAGVLVLAEALTTKQWSGLRAAGIAWILGLMLSAAQLLPFLDLLKLSQRDAGFATDQWPLPISGLLNFFVPLLDMTPSKLGVFSDDRQQWVSAFSVSLPLFALALASWFRPQSWRARLSLAAVLFTLVMALGGQTPVQPWLRVHLPMLGMIRYPVKFIVPVLFFLPLAAGWTIAQAPALSARRIQATGWFCFGVAALLVIVAFVIPWKGEPQGTVLLYNSLRLGLCAGFFVLWRQATIGKAMNWTVIGCLVIVIVDGLTQVPNQNPLVPVRAYAESRNATNEDLANTGRSFVSLEAKTFFDHAVVPQPEQYFAALRSANLNNLNLVDHVAKVDGFFSLQLGPEAELRKALYQTTNPPAGLLDFLGVRRINPPGDVFAWTNRAAMPLVTAGQWGVITNANGALSAVLDPAFDSHRIVYLTAEPGTVPTLASTSAQVSAVKWAAQRITFDVKTTSDTWVVISQAWHPNWHASVNGKAVPLVRANHAFQALAVRDPGAHQVVLEYRDRAFRNGLIISTGTFLVLGHFASRKRYR